MPKVSEMTTSKYLKCADVPDPVIITIKGVKRVNIARDDDEPEYKWVIKFEEYDKPMVLNSTNLHVAAKLLKSDDTDEWTGQELILWADPNVQYKGELVGGLRFRGQEKAPVKAAPRPTRKEKEPGEQDETSQPTEDGLPF